jgi:G-protein coupled receptor 98
MQNNGLLLPANVVFIVRVMTTVLQLICAKPNKNVNAVILCSAFADIIVFRDRGNFGVAKVDWVAAKQFGARTSLTIKNDFSSNTSGTVTFGAGQSTTTIRLQLQNDDIPENGYSFVLYLTNPSAGSDIYSDRKSINVTVEPSDDALGVFQFAANSRYPTVSEDMHSVTLFIQRDFGTLGQAIVRYATREATSSDDLTVGVTLGEIAEEGVDYVYRDGSVEFATGETQKAITIPLGRQSNSKNVRVFFVTLSMPSDDARLGKFFESKVRITPPEDSLTLALLQLESEALTDINEETILGTVMNLQAHVTSLNGEDLNLFLRVLRLVYQKGSSYYSENDEIVRGIMLIFNHMLESAMFRGQSVIALALHQFAFSLVAHDECPVSNPRVVKLEQGLLSVEAMRARPEDINARTFTSRNGDTVSLPNSLVKRNTGFSIRCRDLYFLDFRSDNWFQDGDPIFNSKDGGDAVILSVGLNISSSELQNLEDNVEYKINTKQRVSPNSGECLFWNYDVGRWSSDSCSKQATTVDREYIVCQCNHLTDFAARGDTDDRTGWGPATQISCFVAIAVVFVVWAVSHLASCCHQGDMLTAFRLLMHLLFAIIVTEVALVAAIFQSRNASVDSCAALGGLIHYFGLAQFVLMMILSINLWQTLISNNDETERYYFYYIITGWSIPLLTLAVYMLIGTYQLHWNIEQIYGDVHGNGDMCFIPNVYAALVAVVLPILLCALVVGLVFTQAYQFPSRWKQYDDIFRNANNREEVPKLLLLFTLILLVWVMGGLHLAVSTRATEVLFAVFNIVLACYIIIVYLFMKLKTMREKRSYYPAETFRNGAIAMDKLPPEMRMSHVSIDSHGSRKALVPDPGPWRDLPAETPPPPLVDDRPTQSVSMPADDPESPEFDDLIFALRTGGTLDDGSDDDDDDNSEPLPDKSTASEHYEMRRISITDTRL